MNRNFTHLHAHTTFSFLDGANKITEYIKVVKNLGMDSCAITDHNHCAGFVDFETECNSNGIKPIFGVELYQTWDTNILRLSSDERREHAIKQAINAGIEIPEKINKKKITKKQIDEIIHEYIYDTSLFHIIILAMNQVGYKNLINLQSEASKKCTYDGRYCCDFEMLKKYSEGIIVTSACIGGIIPNCIIKGKMDKAYECAKKYKEIFGDRFYLEIQPLYNEKQILVNQGLIQIAKDLDIQLTASNDIHYTYKEDHDDHDTLLCVGIGKKKNDENRMKYDNEFWVKSYEEMLEGFARHSNIDKNIILTALENTNKIANRIENVKLGSPVQMFPKVDIPDNETDYEYLCRRSFENLYKYLSSNPNLNRKIYEARLKDELRILKYKGYVPYMLTIIENVDYCKSQDIPIGPGRGSAGGSLVLFVNGGTKADPIKYNLLFFRFLTEDRKDPPDVDQDVSYYGRGKLINWLKEKHGDDKIAHIGTINVLGVKSGLKDFARVLDYSFKDSNSITSKIDEIVDGAANIKFKDLENLKEEAEEAKSLGNLFEYEDLLAKHQKYLKLKEQYPDLFRLAMKFEGSARNFGVNASGILVTPCTITEYLPTRTDKNGNTIVLFTGPQVEQLNFIKLDILGLKNLDILDKTIKAIDKDMTVDDLYRIVENHYSDEKLYEPILNKESEGLFQIESNLFKGLARDVGASNINDICVMLSIGRPGPLAAGMHTSYARRKNGEEESLEQLRGTGFITKDSYNTIIYQEQLSSIGW